MPKKRTKIPPATEAEVLFKNDRTCCICQDKTKRVQIHHIDGDPGNNAIDNLAVVCTDHQDEIHKRGGITKGYSPHLIKKYKHHWELTVFKRRTAEFRPLHTKTGIEKVLFDFEIRKTAYEVASLSDNAISGIKQRLELFRTLYMLEGYGRKILKALQYIVPPVALAGKNKASLIAESIPSFFAHLPGPDYVKIRKKDTEDLAIAIDTLETIGSFCGEFNKNLAVIKSVGDSFEYLFNLTVWYDLENYALKIVKEINKVIQACEQTYENERPLTSGVRQLRKLLNKFRKIVKDERPEWAEVLKILK
jgi:hypothetical protein